jgi:hypothetical protein
MSVPAILYLALIENSNWGSMDRMVSCSTACFTADEVVAFFS